MGKTEAEGGPRCNCPGGDESGQIGEALEEEFFENLSLELPQAVHSNRQHQALEPCVGLSGFALVCNRLAHRNSPFAAS